MLILFHGIYLSGTYLHIDGHIVGQQYPLVSMVAEGDKCRKWALKMTCMAWSMLINGLVGVSLQPLQAVWRSHMNWGNASIAWVPFYKHGLTLVPAWISNYIHYKVWDEITYPFLNFNSATVEV